VGRRRHALQTDGYPLYRASRQAARPLRRHPHAVSGAARGSRTPLDRSGGHAHPGPRPRSLAERQRPRAGDQRGAVCPAQPERAGALPEIHRQRRHGERAAQAGTGRARTHADGIPPPPQSLPDGGLEGPGAHRLAFWLLAFWLLAFWLLASAHRRPAATPPPAVVGGVSPGQPPPGQPPSGGVDLAGGSLRAVPDAGDGRSAAVSPVRWGSRGSGPGVDLEWTWARSTSPP